MWRPIFFLIVGCGVSGQALEDALVNLLETSPCRHHLIDGDDNTVQFTVESFTTDNRCYLYGDTFASGTNHRFNVFDETTNLWRTITGYPEEHRPLDGECEAKDPCPEDGGCVEDPGELTTTFPQLIGSSDVRARLAALDDGALRGVYFGHTPPERLEAAYTRDMNGFLVVVPSQFQNEADTTVRSRETWRDYFASAGYEGARHVLSYVPTNALSTDSIVNAYQDMLCGYSPAGGRPSKGWWSDTKRRRVDFITDLGSEPGQRFPSWNALRKTVDTMLGPNTEGRLISFGRGSADCSFGNGGSANPHWNAVFRSAMWSAKYKPTATDYTNAGSEIKRAPANPTCDDDGAASDDRYSLMECLKKLYSGQPKFDGEVVVLIAVGDAKGGDPDEETVEAIQKAAETVRVVPMVVNVGGTDAAAADNVCAMQRLVENLGGASDKETAGWVDYDSNNGGWLAGGVDDINKGPSFEDPDDPEPPIRTELVVRDVWSLGKYIGYLSLVLICAALGVILIILFVRWFILRRQFSQVGLP